MSSISPLAPSFELVYGLIAEKYESASPCSENSTKDHSQLKEVAHKALLAIQNKEAQTPVDREEVKQALSRTLSFSPWKAPQLKESASETQKLAFQWIRGALTSLSAIDNKRPLLQAVFWKRDPLLLSDCRKLIKHLLRDIFATGAASYLDEEASFHMEVVVGELLSLLPFLRPEAGEPLSIPIVQDKKWTLVSYTVERLELTPRSWGSPIVAYGLKAVQKGPKENFGPPILLFKGTTYPSDEGFFLSLLTDINPLAPVGAYAFRLGQKTIADWLHTQEKKALVYGKSLGGALAWQTALAFPDQVDQVMTYGSPGFSQEAVKKLPQLKKEAKPRFHFFCQKNDPIPFFGEYAPSGVHYYEVISSTERQGVMAHASMFSTEPESIIIALDPSQIRAPWKRCLFNVIREMAALIFFFLATLQIVAVSIVHLGRWIKKKAIAGSVHRSQFL